jgi:hypothetical protein
VFDDLVAVLTALDLEYRAVRANLERPQPYLHPAGTVFEIGQVAGTGSAGHTRTDACEAQLKGSNVR